ncbi:MAG TPA: MarR family transcriptional regulator [Polyangiaceae bacterium]
MKDKSKRKRLIDAISDEGRKMSTQTVLFHTAVADRLGLNPSDHKCGDLIISQSEPMTAGRLAEITGLSTGAITGVIDRLEQAGFVVRAHDPSDRRRVVVQPTPERMPDLRRFFEPLRAAMQAVCEKYSEQELELLIDFMQRCREVSAQQVRRLRDEPNEPRRSAPSAERPARPARRAP